MTGDVPESGVPESGSMTVSFIRLYPQEQFCFVIVLIFVAVARRSILVEILGLFNPIHSNKQNMNEIGGYDMRSEDAKTRLSFRVSNLFNEALQTMNECSSQYNIYHSIMMTRLLLDATGTKCNQEIEPVLNTKHSHILRVPFMTEKGILRKWFSRFDIYPYLEKFTQGTTAHALEKTKYEDSDMKWKELDSK
ncbi:sucrose synthase 7 [Artemisia annua]|uniref:sucrose synthase n=1 Tax=Artemisia annua TaxID=35608 RepID=A0A2U1PCD7_ARTAN|nr:sucrose synthase 7 [Artemisia annua]